MTRFTDRLKFWKRSNIISDKEALERAENIEKSCQEILEYVKELHVENVKSVESLVSLMIDLLRKSDFSPLKGHLSQQQYTFKEVKSKTKPWENRIFSLYKEYLILIHEEQSDDYKSVVA